MLLIKIGLMGLTLLFSLVVVSVSNPIYGVLALILLFILTAFLFLANNAEFLAFIYLLVYVDALMILFLWVVMTMPVKKKTAVHLRLTLVGVLLSCFLFLVIFLIDFSSIKFIRIYPDSLLFSSFINFLKNNVEFEFFARFSETSNSFFSLSKVIPPILVKQIHAVKIEHSSFFYNIYVIYSAQCFVLPAPLTIDSAIGQQLLAAFTANIRLNHTGKGVYGTALFLHTLSSLNYGFKFLYFVDWLNSNLNTVLLVVKPTLIYNKISLFLPSFIDLNKYIFINPYLLQNNLLDIRGDLFLKDFYIFFSKLAISPYNNVFVDIAVKLYQNFAACLIITGLILLVAMVGAVTLVKFQKMESKTQNILLQIKRDEIL